MYLESCRPLGAKDRIPRLGAHARTYRPACTVHIHIGACSGRCSTQWRTSIRSSRVRLRAPVPRRGLLQVKPGGGIALLCNNDNSSDSNAHAMHAWCAHACMQPSKRIFLLLPLLFIDWDVHPPSLLWDLAGAYRGRCRLHRTTPARSGTHVVYVHTVYE